MAEPTSNEPDVMQLEIELLRFKVTLGYALDAIKYLMTGNEEAAEQQLVKAREKLLGS